MSKLKSKQEEALQFLDELDALSPTPEAAPASAGAARAQATATPQNAADGDAADVLQFIDEITQKSSEPPRSTSRSGTPTLRKATERVRVGSPAPYARPEASTTASAAQPKAGSPPKEATPAQPARAAGWGWGNVWSSASAALQQAKTAVEDNVKNLPNNEQAKKWGEGVLGYVPVNREQLEKFGHDFRTVGFSTLNELLNVVAPPITEHEVIQVWLSHDMEGYDGVESVVYRALSRILEQVEGGDLIVNKGHESKPRDSDAAVQRNLNAVEGVEAAIKLAEANIEELIKSKGQHPKPLGSPVQNPTTYSYIYFRIQPFYSTLALSQPNTIADAISEAKNEKLLQFLLHLSDPEHQLSQTTLTQAFPLKWFDVLEKHEWIEDLLVEGLRVGVEVIGQEYIVARMGWLKDGTEASDPSESAGAEKS